MLTQVFRDLAQGAFRLRGIGIGQTITLIIIPEVQQLLRRQLTKAGSAVETLLPSGAAKVETVQLLQNVSCWLVLNAMAAERTQFDQLQVQNRSHQLRHGPIRTTTHKLQVGGDSFCDWLQVQNLSNIWRQNAFDVLLAGHRNFKVRGEAEGELMLEMLGEVFVSNELGSVRRNALENKTIGLYFEGTSHNRQLFKTLKTIFVGFYRTT